MLVKKSAWHVSPNPKTPHTTALSNSISITFAARISARTNTHGANINAYIRDLKTTLEHARNMAQASFNRGKSKQTYETPPDFMRAVSERFGPIAFDLACEPETAKAKRFYTRESDAFQFHWHKNRGLLWLNPPYDNISPWAERFA
jgi:hypothetical protein